MKKHVFTRVLCVVAIMAFCFVSFGQTTKTTQSVSAKTESQLEKEIAESKKKQQELQAEIDKTKNNIAKEKENQNAISQKISVTESQITNLNTKIDTLNSQIATTEANIQTQEEEITKGVEDFKQRLRAMYLAGNDSYAEVLAGSSDFYDFLMKYKLVKNIAAHDKTTIDNLIKQKEALDAQKVSLSNDKAEVESTKATLDANKSDLTSLYSQSQDTIDEINKEKQQYESMSADEKKAQENAQKELDKIIADKMSNNTVYVGGTFTWPVPSVSRITSYYGSRWGSFHYGIDISNGSYGAPIVAANSGTVIVAMNNAKYGSGYGGYGNVVVIDHGGGYATLYGHCQSFNVSVGQKVTKGQTIAYIGSSGQSTGPHLHFEIRVNGQKQNPMNWFSKK